MLEQSDNNVEALLKKAAVDAGYRPQFYRELIKATIYVMTAAASKLKAENNTQISVLYWKNVQGDPLIPIFSSLKELEKAAGHSANYLAINAKTFFQSTLGQVLILNPISEYSKELLPAEICSLLKDDNSNNLFSINLQKKDTIYIGKPDIWPEELIIQLKILFSSSAAIESAYIAQVFNPVTDDKPHLLVGLQGKDDLMRVIYDAVIVVKSLFKSNEYIDFISLNEENQLSRYIKKLEPFYYRPN